MIFLRDESYMINNDKLLITLVYYKLRTAFAVYIKELKEVSK